MGGPRFVVHHIESSLYKYFPCPLPFLKLVQYMEIVWLRTEMRFLCG